MTIERETLRDWHRLFGLLLTDFFSGSPFIVDVERDLSVQQQLLDVVIVRRGRGRYVGRLPDGLEGLRPHNLMGKEKGSGVESQIIRAEPQAQADGPRDRRFLTL